MVSSLIFPLNLFIKFLISLSSLILDFASLYFFVFSASLTASGESITVPTSKLTSTSFENNSFKIALNSREYFQVFH